MTMAINLPGAPNKATEPSTYTAQQIRDKLVYWSEHLREHNAGTNSVITRLEIRTQLDRWLDELLALRGR